MQEDHWQGRTPEQVEKNYQVAVWIFRLGLAATIIALILYALGVR